MSGNFKVAENLETSRGRHVDGGCLHGRNNAASHRQNASTLRFSAALMLFATLTAAWPALPAPLGTNTGIAIDARPASSTSATSDSKLRRLTEQAPSRNGGSGELGPGTAAGGSGYTGQIAPERLQERAQLLKTGEAALARLELDAAIHAFDRAALIQHAADTEISLIRAYMQGGQYRRALASGAHTAGSHLDDVAASALYAWLLSAGGQGVIGQRLLDEVDARLLRDATSDPIVTAVQQQLHSGTPTATGVLLGVPTRLAPYSSGPVLPRRAHVAGSALLLAGGRQALAPLALVPKAGKGSNMSVWVRNGMGALTAATVVARLPAAGVALLALNTALPVAQSPGVAVTEAFPGSAAFAVEYSATPTAGAAWPLLRTGFLGGMTKNPTRPEECALGIAMPPGPRGGPVFDAAGRLIGIALASQGRQRTTQPILVSAPTLRRELAKAAPAASLGASSATLPAGSVAVAGRVPVDVIYENAMRSTLQLITLH